MLLSRFRSTCIRNRQPAFLWLGAWAAGHSSLLICESINTYIGRYRSWSELLFRSGPVVLSMTERTIFLNGKPNSCFEARGVETSRLRPCRPNFIPADHLVSYSTHIGLLWKVDMALAYAGTMWRSIPRQQLVWNPTQMHITAEQISLSILGVKLGSRFHIAMRRTTSV